MSKADKKCGQKLRDNVIREADLFLDEIDEVLEQNSWDGPRRLRRPRGRRLEGTDSSESEPTA